MGQEVMEIKEEDEGEGGKDEDEARSGFGGKLSGDAREQEDGGNEVEPCVDVLEAVFGEARAVGAEVPCRC